MGLRSRYGARQRVTQAEVAELVGYSSVWYGMLERGQRDPGYSEEFLDGVAAVLRLNFHERIVLYRLAVGREPAPRALTALPEVDVATRQMLDEVCTPAWCMTPAGDVLAHNDATSVWLRHMVESVPRNFLRWVCASDSAREQLINWRDDWAGPAVAQLRAALAERPGDERIRDVLSAVLSASPDLRAGWDAAPQVRVHPGHAVRRLRIPGRPEGVGVHHISMQLTANPGVQLFAILPHGGRPISWGHLPPPLG
jgi:hypothetical protein